MSMTQTSAPAGDLEQIVSDKLGSPAQSHSAPTPPKRLASTKGERSQCALPESPGTDAGIVDVTHYADRVTLNATPRRSTARSCRRT
jgi:hypothetical protein